MYADKLSHDVILAARYSTTGAFNIVPDSILRQIVMTFTAAAMRG
jgi:hypothetical protein